MNESVEIWENIVFGTLTALGLIGLALAACYRDKPVGTTVDDSDQAGC